MIDLFEENRYIKCQRINEVLSFDIESRKGLVIKLDWNKFSAKDLVIAIHGVEEVSILEVGRRIDSSVIYALDDYAKLSLCIASFEEGIKSKCRVSLGKQSEFKGAYADFSYGKVEYDFECDLLGEGASSTWNLASLTTKNDDKSFTISFSHKARETYAKMENYGVCEDYSKLSFLGTAHIEKGAKGTSTHQSAKIMVFDPKCKATASPILKIDENDVQASHASTVGQINEDHIFYLMSRGIKEDEAKRIITLGYLNPILAFFEDEETLESIKTNIERRI